MTRSATAARAPRALAGRALAAAATALVLGACGNLDSLTYEPTTSPEQWCDQRPCVDLGGTVLTEPLGTVLVFTLALAWIVSGGYFLRTRRGQRSRAWLGVALVLGGLGAAQAGISYQALSYELKCAGLEACRLTNGWEVGYSLTQALSVSAMLVAVAHACSTGRLRRGLVWFAGLNAAAYLVVTVIGVALPSATLLSFPVLMAFALPGIVLVIAVAGRRYRSTRDPMARSLVVAALLLVAVQVAYFAYWATGITATLWDEGQGFYFSENDVLHVGMLIWLWYVVAVVGRHLHDATEGAVTGGR